MFTSVTKLVFYGVRRTQGNVHCVTIAKRVNEVSVTEDTDHQDPHIPPGHIRERHTCTPTLRRTGNHVCVSLTWAGTLHGQHVAQGHGTGFREHRVGSRVTPDPVVRGTMGDCNLFCTYCIVTGHVRRGCPVDHVLEDEAASLIDPSQPCEYYKHHNKHHHAFQLATAILALLPLALCGSSADVLSTLSSTTLDVRAAEPINLTPNGPYPRDQYFMVTAFEAFMPSPPHSGDFSRTMFNIILMHPVPARRWTTQCVAHTKGKLCDPNTWSACMPVSGAANKNEGSSFKFGENLTSVDIMRHWRYGKMYLKTMASEPATWAEKVDENDKEGNVTVSEMGKLYEKPESWMFTWRQAVG
ncbi:hypothetical protein BU25DRAFT_417437 [Macroventuria anomochaeta]|uniref:Uncharacterized protein n=1 Tax=Macroventuria anomochaeta TaxID=301207 RepID=A0ACB6SFB9_9PLEO|nr:uncharacterized protein BU25DRAFT_417437 [Macroventuria anomochaeta]KAF2632861.1 hypothetical protein BU25DRAFT_417437 [Macroventuria anomochaeta]